MKKLIVKISSAMVILLAFCTFTAATIEDKMKIQVDYVPIQTVSDFEINIPYSCVQKFQNGKQGIFYTEDSDGLWEKESSVFSMEIFPEEVKGNFVIVETSQKMIVGYSSQELEEGMKVKKVGP